jgi:hypothetical protein
VEPVEQSFRSYLHCLGATHSALRRTPLRMVSREFRFWENGLGFLGGRACCLGFTLPESG